MKNSKKSFHLQQKIKGQSSLIDSQFHPINKILRCDQPMKEPNSWIVWISYICSMHTGGQEARESTRMYSSIIRFFHNHLFPLQYTMHLLVGSSGIICFARSLFILNMSVQSVSNTKRSASLQMIFLLLLGSWRLFFRIYAHSCFTIWYKWKNDMGVLNIKNQTEGFKERISYLRDSEPQSSARQALQQLFEVQEKHHKLWLDHLGHLFFYLQSENCKKLVWKQAHQTMHCVM